MCNRLPLSTRELRVDGYITLNKSEFSKEEVSVSKGKMVRVGDVGGIAIE